MVNAARRDRGETPGAPTDFADRSGTAVYARAMSEASTAPAAPAAPTAPVLPHRPNLRPRKLLKTANHANLHPTVWAEAEHRAGSVQLVVADAITTFAGSMWFVYLHVVLFAVWMLWIEKSPWPTLTLIVSLEAIFLSTFVMIGQNRQGRFQQAKADRDYQQQEKLLVENTDLTRLIHRLSNEIHERVVSEVNARLAASSDAGAAPAPSEPQP